MAWLVSNAGADVKFGVSDFQISGISSIWTKYGKQTKIILVSNWIFKKKKSVHSPSRPTF